MEIKVKVTQLSQGNKMVKVGDKMEQVPVANYTAKGEGVTLTLSGRDLSEVKDLTIGNELTVTVS